MRGSVLVIQFIGSMNDLEGVLMIFECATEFDDVSTFSI